MRKFDAFTVLGEVYGKWTPSDGSEPLEDSSRKYAVAVDEEQLEELRDLLRRAGNSFDQQTIYLAVAGYAEELNVHPENGYLEL